MPWWLRIKEFMMKLLRGEPFLLFPNMVAILNFKMATIFTYQIHIWKKKSKTGSPLKSFNIKSSTIMPIFMLLYQNAQYFGNILY